MTSRPYENDAIIALAGVRFTPDGVMGDDSLQRAETAVDLFHAMYAPNIVLAGAYPSTGRQHPEATLAEQMRDFVLDSGVPEDNVFIENRSVDTIGNAIFTKREIVLPEGWNKIAIVSSDSHIKRAMRTFNHVYGPRFGIEGVGSGETPYKKQIFNEVMGEVALYVIAHGIALGDDEAIEERLVGIVPGYEDIATSQRLVNLVHAALSRS